MRKRIALLAVAGVLVVGPARADYVVKDGNGVLQTVKSGTVGGGIQPVMSPVDASGNPFGVSNNPVYTAFGTGVLLPQFASAAHFICDSGCSGGGGGSSYTVTFGNAIGTLGTPGGFKDASGNFQSLLGDTTNGLWVNIKSSASLGVTGTFWQATQPVSIASMPSTPVTGTFWQSTQPVSGTFWQTTQPVSIASMPSTPVTGTFWQTTQPISAASLPLPSGAATQATLASVLSALGSPFQAGASIGNTTFGATQSGTWNLNNIAGTISLPTGAATSANQSTEITSLGTIATNSGTQATSANQTTIITALGTLHTDNANPVPLGSTTGGWTRTLFAGLSTTVQTVKSSAGQVAKLYCDNPNATAIYVETFDVSGTVTLGTTAPTQAYYIPATNAAGFTLSLVGDQYANAIKIAAVTTENGSTAPGTPGNCNVSWN